MLVALLPYRFSELTRWSPANPLNKLLPCVDPSTKWQCMTKEDIIARLYLIDRCGILELVVNPTVKSLAKDFIVLKETLLKVEVNKEGLKKILRSVVLEMVAAKLGLDFELEHLEKDFVERAMKGHEALVPTTKVLLAFAKKTKTAPQGTIKALLDLCPKQESEQSKQEGEGTGDTRVRSKKVGQLTLLRVGTEIITKARKNTKAFDQQHGVIQRIKSKAYVVLLNTGPSKGEEKDFQHHNVEVRTQEEPQAKRARQARELFGLPQEKDNPEAST